jgi:LmbE family N-acetylglucosaminyl deacetylase
MATPRHASLDPVTDTALAPLPDDWTRALVIVAHPDDVEWGTSAAVAAWTATGKSVAYVLATRGEAGIEGVPPAEAGPLREAEQRAAGAAVGVDDITFLDHRDGHLQEGLALRHDLAAAIRRARPDLVVTLNHNERFGAAPGAPWNSADHRAVGRSVLDAVADAANRWIFTDLVDAGLEPWAGTRWVAVAASPTPTHAVDASTHAEAAVASLAAHRRYLEVLHPGADVEAVARGIVTAISAGGAVTFELLPGPAA